MAPPGWYPDPDDLGAARYWNGQRWDEPAGPLPSDAWPSWVDRGRPAAEQLTSAREARRPAGDRTPRFTAWSRSPSLLTTATALLVVVTVVGISVMDAVPTPCEQLAAFSEGAPVSELGLEAAVTEHDRLLRECKASGGSLPLGEGSWSLLGGPHAPMVALR